MDTFVDFISQATGLSCKTRRGSHLLFSWSWAVSAGKEKHFKDDEEECSVCLSGLTEGDYTRRLPCHHSFHRTCINKWLDVCGGTCPLCRLPVSQETNAKGDELTDEMVIWFSSFHVTGF